VESWVVEQHTVFMIYAYCKHGDLANYLNKVKDQVSDSLRGKGGLSPWR
jgi:hypothetical protein